jgi:LysM repeat protein
MLVTSVTRRLLILAALVSALALSMVVVGPTPAGATTVRVLPGQTLSAIAAFYGTSASALAAANGIADPNHILAGSNLTIPQTAGSPASGVAASGASRTVTVGTGDTLTAIAARYGVSVASLAGANGIADVNHILLGSTLAIPGPGTTVAPATASRSVTVALGDTLTAIAARYGVSVATLAAANGIANPNSVIAGTHLVVPAAAAPTPPSVSNSPLPPLLLAYPDRLALRTLFVQWANEFGVPAALLEAMCWWESGWQAQVVSPTGAVGIGQLEPATVAQMRAQLGQPGLNALVPSDNIEMSAGFLADLLRATGNARSALASYYQGIASLEMLGEFPSTFQYVSGITAYVPAFS